jgi:hypothetical protein
MYFVPVASISAPIMPVASVSTSIISIGKRRQSQYDGKDGSRKKGLHDVTPLHVLRARH